MKNLDIFEYDGGYYSRAAIGCFDDHGPMFGLCDIGIDDKWDKHFFYNVLISFFLVKKSRLFLVLFQVSDFNEQLRMFSRFLCFKENEASGIRRVFSGG